MGLWMPALPGVHSGRPAGRSGRRHAHRHGPAAQDANCASPVGAAALPGGMRRTSHHSDRQAGPFGAGQLGRLLETDQSYDAEDFLPPHFGPPPRFRHHLRLLPLLRRQGRRTAGSTRLQGKYTHT